MLSIIIITRNRCEELKRAIESCEKRISIEHEYVIIDNGSEDDTPNMIERLAFPNIRYYMQNYNLGVAGGRNKGFELANGDICYFLDDDAIVSGEGVPLDKAYEFMKKHDNISAMGTDCFDEMRGNYLRPLLEKSYQNDIALIRGFVGVSHFVRKETWNEGLLYPDLFPYGGEELYVGLKTYRYGKSVCYYKDLLVIHKPSNKTRFTTKDTCVWSYTNEMLIKSYFLPKLYIPISWIFFILRVFKGTRFNITAVIKCCKCYHSKFQSTQINRMSLKQTNYLMKKFGIKMIL